MTDPIDPAPGVLTPAMQLLAACCDHPPGGDGAQRIADLIGQIDDWQEFARLTRRHQVGGFVAERLGSNNEVPAGIREELSKDARVTAALNLRQAQVTGHLHNGLKAAGIENLVLKGLPLAIRLYGSLSIKRSADIDLLIRDADAPAALERLGQRGFRAVATGKPVSRDQLSAVMRHHKEIELVDDEGTIVDLHWRLVHGRSTLSGIDPFGNSSKVELDRIGKIAVLGAADEFAYLCAHGAFSHWSRFKWLVDVNALIRAAGENELSAYYAHAVQLGAGACALQALALRAIFWGHPPPPALQGDFETFDREALVGYPLYRMAASYRPQSARESARRINRERKLRAQLSDNRADSWDGLASHLYALPDMLALPLPRALDWLYPLLRPAFWLTRRLR